MFRITALTILTAAASLAQTAATAKLPDVQAAVHIADADAGPVTIAGGMVNPDTALPGAPYSAQTTTERVQILADGNRIEETTSGSVARDSQGRMRREEVLQGLGSNNADVPRLVLLFDPIAKAQWTLDPQAKSAVKMPIPVFKSSGPNAAALPPLPPLPASRALFLSSVEPNDPSPHIQIITKTQSSDGSVSKTDLGTQTIEGVPAQGTRTVRTIPAGAIGNEQPIVITTETWFSPDLKVLISSKTTDPRIGETTYKLTNIQRAEPPADLFQVPADYTVKDNPGNAFFFRQTQKAQ